MSIFTIVNNNIVIAPENLLIPEFKTIYDRDKSKDKEVAFKELGYIYHIADYKSVYNNLDEEEKRRKVKNDFFDAAWFPDDCITEAIEKYTVLQETPSMKLLKDARKAVAKIRAYFDTVDLDERDAKGNLVNKITELSNAIGNIGKIVESLDKLEEKIKKEQLKDTKIRGQAEISSYEREV